MANVLVGSMQEALVTTLLGLGYRLVDIQMSPRYGLIRLFIERCAPMRPNGEALSVQPLWAHLPMDSEASEFTMTDEHRDINGQVGIEDCSMISQHVSRWLMVEDIDYQRLEVSSPGIDRRLSTMADFHRFSGFPIRLELKHSLPSLKEGGAPQRRFRGHLLPIITEGRVEFTCEGQSFSCLVEDIDDARIDEETWLNEQSALKKGNRKPRVRRLKKNASSSPKKVVKPQID